MTIRRCSPCRPHPYQDAKYGAGNRVMVEFNTTTETVGYRCTVCGEEQRSAYTKPKQKEKKK